MLERFDVKLIIIRRKSSVMRTVLLAFWPETV